MLCPFDVVLRAQQIAFQRLLLGRGDMDVGIEVQLAQDQFAAVDAGLARAIGAGVEQAATQAVTTRMSQDQQAAHDSEVECNRW